MLAVKRIVRDEISNDFNNHKDGRRNPRDWQRAAR
jgi:hypothetical protein